MERDFNLTFKIEHSMVRYVIGKRGVQIKKIVSATATQIYFGKDVDENGEIDCCVSGGGKKGKRKAQGLIQTFLTDFKAARKESEKSTELKNRAQNPLNSKSDNSSQTPKNKRKRGIINAEHEEPGGTAIFPKQKLKRNQSCRRCDRKFGNCIGLEQLDVMKCHIEMCRKRRAFIKPKPKRKNVKTVKKRAIQLHADTQLSHFKTETDRLKKVKNKKNKWNATARAHDKTTNRSIMLNQSSARDHIRHTNEAQIKFCGYEVKLELIV